jgi:hypothetical protein
VQATTTHTDKKVEVIHGPDTRSCVFFKLKDVAEADSVTPDIPWFAVSKEHIAYDEIFSILLSARMTDAELTVYTTGETVCGHAEVITVRF